MAKTKISEFSATPANNTDIDSINIAEGCAPSGINDAIRELMAQLKDFQTGAVGDSFNGPIGSTSAVTGAFTTLSATGAITSTLATGSAPFVIASTTKVANLNVDLLDGADWAAPAALGSTTPAAVSATTLTTSSTVTLNGGTANGVAYLNGSKVVTSGSALNYATGTGTGNLLEVTGGSNNINGQINIQGTDGTNTSFVSLLSGLEPTNLPSLFFSNGLRFALATNKAASGYSEQMRLNSTGLGIGTSSPTAKLYVNANNSTATAIFQDENNGAKIRLLANSINFDLGNNGTNAYLAVSGATSLAFNTNSTERLRLDGSGNLGLGVTPSAWDGALKAIQVNTQGVFASETSAVHVMTNVYYNSGYKYIGTGYATDYYQYNGLHAWRTASSGTAGNAITWTQAMTLDASGNLGVGTTSPSTRLHVSSSGNTELRVQAGATAFLELVNGNSYRYDIQSNSADNSLRLVDQNVGSERARIDSSGNFMVGTTSGTGAKVYFSDASNSQQALIAQVSTYQAANFINNTAAFYVADFASLASSGNNLILSFSTDATPANRGSVTYNRAGGVILYNTTSDYRAKDIAGPVTNSGSLIDSVPVYMGKMKGATQERPMFIAHETPEYAHTGEKDAVDADGNPVYQQMDASALIPVMWAEIQSLRKRLADAGI